MSGQTVLICKSTIQLLVGSPYSSRCLALFMGKGPDFALTESMITHHTKEIGMEGYGKRVLVVEDDVDVRSIICAILIAAGYNVYEAGDGMEALEALKKRRYDAVLTDFHMPKMDGLELLDLARAMWPDLPVILASSDTLLTGHTGSSLLDPAYAVLEKPFHRSSLLSVIRSAIHGLPKPNPPACLFLSACHTVA